MEFIILTLTYPSNFSEPLRYSSRYSHANEVDGGGRVGSGGEAADDASLPAIHKSRASKNNHMLPNGDGGGRAPIRIPVPPVTREDDLLPTTLMGFIGPSY